jgi:hypothetical protein
MKLKILTAATAARLLLASCQAGADKTPQTEQTAREITNAQTTAITETQTESETGTSGNADTEYLSGANAAFSGFAAFDDEYIYYVNNADNNNLYKIAYGGDRGTIIAKSNEYGFLHSIAVWGERVYFISRYDTENDEEGTEGNSYSKCYSVDKNGGDLRTEFENAGEIAVTDGKIVYTGDPMRADYTLNIYDIATGTSEKISDNASHMSAADNKIVYIGGDYPTIMLYDIIEKSNKEIAPFIMAADFSVMIYRDKIIAYSFNFDETRGKIVSSLEQYDISTGERTVGIDRGENVSPAENGDSAVCNGYTLYGGKLWYYKYEWSSSTEAIRSFYSYDFENPPFLVMSEEVTLDEFVSNQPYIGVFTTPRDIYLRNDDGTIQVVTTA